MLTRLVPKLFSSHPSHDFPSVSGPGHTYDGRSGAQRSGNGKRDTRKGFVMTTITAGRSGRNMDERGESQDDLTDNSGSGHGRSLDAKVEVHDMA
jgi:hypothetical protein